jgi:hypothetical protein
MQVYGLHSACRYVFVPTDGPVVLFEFSGCEHIAPGHPGVAEVHRAIPFYYFVSGPRVEEKRRRGRRRSPIWRHDMAAANGGSRSIGWTLSAPGACRSGRHDHRRSGADRPRQTDKTDAGADCDPQRYCGMRGRHAADAGDRDSPFSDLSAVIICLLRGEKKVNTVVIP